MANPYDFTSGYFQSRSLTEQRKQAEEINQYRTQAIQIQKDELEANKEYKSALAGQARSSALEADARTTSLHSQNKLNDLFYPKILKILNKNNPQLSSKNAVAYDPNKYASPDYGFKADYNLIDPSDPEDFDRYADGTKGGLKMPKQPQALDTSAEVAQPNAMALDERISPLQILNQNDPQKALTLTQNIFGATPKEFQEMLGAFSLMDFARGKATSTDLMNQVDKIRKMQAEGVGVAMQRGLTGDFKGAAAAFDESGDERFSDNIKEMKKIRIQNDVPGAVKNTKNFYDGLELTLKDGSKMTLDPRRFMAETVGLKEVVDNEIKVNEGISRIDATNNTTAAHAESNRLNRELQATTKADAAQNKLMQTFQSGLAASKALEYKAWLTNPNPNYDINEASKIAKQNDIETDYGPAQYIGNLNILNNNKSIDPMRAKKYSGFISLGQPGAKEFWDNDNNFQLAPDGQRLQKETQSGLLFVTKDNVILPAPMPGVKVKAPAAPETNPSTAGSKVSVGNAAAPTQQTAIPPVQKSNTYGTAKYTIQGIPLKTFKTPEDAEKAWVEQQQKVKAEWNIK